MVWFQCEDCGENLKKPKLPNHFRCCSASKFSCIDCGEVFRPDSVQGHTQCITEAEKYGPKGQGKASNGATPKTNKGSKQQPDVDINVGLSERPPWFCSLCNTKATSKQTLLLHADGKKHRAKARAFHAASGAPKQTGGLATDTSAPVEKTTNGKLGDPTDLDGEQGMLKISKVENGHSNSEVENGVLPSKKRRKLDEYQGDGNEKPAESDAMDGAQNAVAVIEVKSKETESRPKKAKYNMLEDEKVVESNFANEDTKKKIKWKKLIKAALTSNPDRVLKMRKLKKFVLKSLQEADLTKDEAELSNILEQKVNSSSRFRLNGKCVHLVATD
ncbi:hypothetical protein K2173_004510 [Erythroxylum novogranatense]|uniref:U1-type domain-containing protein n=1 Tax=Erythroxylum novogranatense TaxID=1862640 RepID=A0AAV8TIJ5_9ROSI|nr:hypothetical protein K2173_004510 [Erythroxylum novogranatense]